MALRGACRVLVAAPILTLALGLAASPPASASPADPAHGAIAGRVLWNDRGLEGVTVQSCSVKWAVEGGKKKFDSGLPVYGGCETRETTRTGADGSYSFDAVTPGEYVLMAQNGEMWTFMSGRARQVRLAIAGTGINVAPYAVSVGKTTVADPITFIREVELENPIRAAKVEAARPTLKWKEMEGAKQYKVSLFPGAPQGGLGGVRLGPQVVLQHPVAKAEFSSPRALGNCGYLWWVEAYNAAGTKIAESWNYYRTTQKAREDIGYFIVSGQPKEEYLGCH